jgi:hypothetical protein
MLAQYLSFNIIYIMRSDGMFAGVAYLRVSVSHWPQQFKAPMVGLVVASIEGCWLVPTDLQPVGSYCSSRSVTHGSIGTAEVLVSNLVTGFVRPACRFDAHKETALH